MRFSRIAGILLLIIVAIAMLSLFMFRETFRVVTAFSAKNACSCHFIGERTLDDIQNDELSQFPLNLASIRIAKGSQTVESSLFGLFEQQAKYKGDLGCQLIHGKDNAQNSFVNRNKLQADNDWNKLPSINNTTPIVNEHKLEQAFNFAFSEEFKTRGLLVVKNGHLVKEEYAAGYDANSLHLGWSMTKSIGSCLIGILVREGKLSLNDKAPVEQWKGTPKENISIKNLLQMSSGLDWEEDYTRLSSANKLLWREEDVMEFASDQGMEAEIGSHWEYSSGTTNILSGIIRNCFDSDQEYWSFPYRKLFNKIGMNTAILETDEAGNFVLSSFCYATAKDWAKFGQLYLNEGKWEDEQIIDSDWVEFSHEQITSTPYGQYGAQFWINTNDFFFDDLPHDLYFASGFNGQRVIIIPSEQMVIVRLGMNKQIDWSGIIKQIIQAIN